MRPYITVKLAADALMSIWRNPSVSIAGILLSLIAFLSFGTAASVYYNIGRNIERIQTLPEIEVFMYPDAKKTDRDSLGAELEKTLGVTDITYVSKDEAFLKAKQMVGADNEVLDVLGKDFLPESFIIDLDNKYNIEDIAKIIKSYSEVESISYSGDETEFINKISRWSRYLSLIVFAVSLFLSFITITALIRITVYARKKEIQIKRYMGASNYFIMLPFILEGVIISFIGAAASWLIFLGVYGNLADMFKSLMSGLTLNIFEIVPVDDFKYILLLMLSAASIAFGFISGLYAVRRHLIIGGH